eukprot:gene7314-8483_t
MHVPPLTALPAGAAVVAGAASAGTPVGTPAGTPAGTVWEPDFGLNYTLRVTTAAAEAQRYFDAGLLHMYGFNKQEARRAFAAAVAADGGCAMCHCGGAADQVGGVCSPALGRGFLVRPDGQRRRERGRAGRLHRGRYRAPPCDSPLASIDESGFLHPVQKHPARAGVEGVDCKARRGPAKNLSDAAAAAGRPLPALEAGLIDAMARRYAADGSDAEGGWRRYAAALDDLRGRLSPRSDDVDYVGNGWCRDDRAGGGGRGSRGFTFGRRAGSGSEAAGGREACEAWCTALYGPCLGYSWARSHLECVIHGEPALLRTAGTPVDGAEAQGDLCLRRHTVDRAQGDLCLRRHTVDRAQGDLCLRRHTVDRVQGDLCLRRHTVDGAQGDLCLRRHTVDRAQGDLCLRRHTVDGAQGDLCLRRHTVDGAQGDLCLRRYTVDRAQGDLCLRRHTVDRAQGDLCLRRHTQALTAQPAAHRAIACAGVAPAEDIDGNATGWAVECWTTGAVWDPPAEPPIGAPREVAAYRARLESDADDDDDSGSSSAPLWVLFFLLFLLLCS